MMNDENGRCPVCAAVRATIKNALSYLDNAPHAEINRANVVAFARSILNAMDETQNAESEVSE